MVGAHLPNVVSLGSPRHIQSLATVIPYAQEKLIYSSSVNVKRVLGEFKLPTL